ncbi:hypothetical protein [Bacillus sp. CECT 9360]|uniref:hypothetical protein n=1 Tax=Bacillus sp. CECT 9360 TaxID=2845821 RepID=UPI001E43A377|nr:hypothetical protein [Bacillus sp. CECT 9360]CAH0346988.1 hypothetical protein BCI9360_03359 [Bacillus sp. CECT 9360]
MKSVFVIELGVSPDEFPDLYRLLEEQVEITDRFESMLLISSKKEAQLCMEISTAAEAFVEIHSLLEDASFIPLELFEDYGFITEASTYLFKQSLECFRFALGGKTEIEMTLLELEEILIARSDENVYFIDAFQKDLVLGVAKAYQVQLSFLALDK